jgi:bacteriocin-like protein
MGQQKQTEGRKPVTNQQASKKPSERAHVDLTEDELKQVSGGGKTSLSDFSFTA